MDKNKLKEGLSVKEIEEFTKKHRFEVFWCIALVFACFFSFFIFSPGWGIFFASIGGILGITLADKIENLARSVFGFIAKQEQTIQIVIGVAFLIVSIFLSPLIFLLLGMHGGKSIYRLLMEYTNKG